jgi:hypothetical protein
LPLPLFILAIDLLHRIIEAAAQQGILQLVLPRQQTYDAHFMQTMRQSLQRSARHPTTGAAQGSKLTMLILCRQCGNLCRAKHHRIGPPP